MKTIITTVGTSIFENYLQAKSLFDKEGRRANPVKKHNEKEIVKEIDKIKKEAKAAKCIDYYRKLDDIKEILRKDWLQGITKVNTDWKFEQGLNEYASAEIESIIKIQKDLKQKVQVYLICTDTVLSVLAAELITDFFNSEDFGKTKFSDIDVIFEQADKHIADKLRVSDNDEYQEGFLSLMKITNEVIDIEKKENCILNITGGYKAIIPIMTLIGQLREVSLNYLYEDNEQNEKPLVQIGNLPLNFDWDYIYHWELLLRKASLDYISPLFSSYQFLEERSILNHQHLHIKDEFKKLNLSEENKNDLLKTRDIYPLYCKIIKEKVLVFQDNKLKLTLLGIMLREYATHKQLVGSRRMGPLVELFFYKFFSISPEKKLTKINKLHLIPYKVNIDPTYQPIKFSVNEDDLMILDDILGEKDAKDIDINLLNTETDAIVLGECKTAWAFINASEKEDYLAQIKARILRQYQINKDNNINKGIEFLFLVMNFSLFKDLEFDDYEEKYQKIVTAASIFEELSNDNQIKNEIKDIDLNIKTMLLTRKLTFDKQQKVDWKSFLLNVDSKDYNEVVIL